MHSVDTIIRYFICGVHLFKTPPSQHTHQCAKSDALLAYKYMDSP